MPSHRRFFAFLFLLSVALPAQDVPPVIIKQVKPVYPLSMGRSGLRGEVTVGFIVGTDGGVRDAIILSSNNPHFNKNALESVRRYRFKPALKDGKPVEVRGNVPIIFIIENPDGTGGRPFYDVREGDAAALDTPPVPVEMAEPVYPYELLRQHVSGTTELVFLVRPDGSIGSLKIEKTDRPEFGLASAAAVERHKFKPALKDNKPVEAILRQKFEFSRILDDPASRDTRRLLSIEKKKPEKIIPPAKLDSPLKPVWHPKPVFPVALAGRVSTGDTEVEFLVNEEGFVGLPRVISTSEPEFGYAAAQAVSAWKFEAPRHGGKPAITRARLPLTFRSRSAK